jgi:hypothetical protein
MYVDILNDASTHAGHRCDVARRMRCENTHARRWLYGTMRAHAPDIDVM